MREGRINIFLNGDHFSRLPTIVSAELASNLERAIWRREVSMHAVLIVQRKWILVGSDYPALRRVVEGRQLIEGNKALPFIIAGAPIHGNIAIVSLPNWQQPARVIADVAVHICVDKVLPGAWKPADGG